MSTSELINSRVGTGFNEIDFIYNSENILKKIKVIIGNTRKYIHIIDVLGASNAVVYDIRMKNMPTAVCLKLAPSGTINLDNNKINYINSHPDDYTKVYYFQQNIELPTPLTIVSNNPKKTRQWQNFDLLIMEKTDSTLGNILKTFDNNECLSINVLDCLTNKLMSICNDLINSKYFYIDLKPDNIGITTTDGLNYTFKLIDVDSLFSRESNLTYTTYTFGNIQKNKNLIRIQYLSAIFTIIASLYNDNYKAICTTDYSMISNVDNTIINYMQSFKDNGFSLKCASYKMTLIIGMYEVLKEASLAIKQKLNSSFINVYYNELIESISKLISIMNLSTPNNDTLYKYIANLLLTMIYVIIEKEDKDIPTFISKKYDIHINCSFTGKQLKTNYNIIPYTTVGLAIVNTFYKMIQRLCNDTTCSTIIDTGYNIINYKYQ